MIEWKKTYSVSSEVLDNQHKTFFGLLDRLESLTTENNYLEGLPLLLNEIVEYTTLHFKTEEDILEKVNYPELEAHKLVHHQIKKDIYLKCTQVIEKEPTAVDIIWLYNYMKDWIKNHILEEDIKYIPYMKQ